MDAEFAGRGERQPRRGLLAKPSDGPIAGLTLTDPLKKGVQPEG
jgi:hypothetical protein